MSKKNNSVQSSESAQRPKRSKKVMRTAMIAVVSTVAASAIVGLSVALYFSEERYYTQMTYQRQMESVYSRSYYDLQNGANDLDVKMRKLNAASTNEKQQSLLYEVWSTANLAESNLAVFEGADEGVMKAQKFMNQLGDYSHYLALKLADGERLNANERETLNKLGGLVGVLKEALNGVQNELDNGRLFIADNGLIDGFTEAFSSFSDPSMEYPEMIYDGPFSDALQNREPKGLTGEEISESEGKEKLMRYFGKEVNEINYIGETKGDIITHNYSFNLGTNSAFAQISKKGGRLVAFNMNPPSTSAEGGDCKAAALSFAKKAGYENMQVVWSAASGGVCYVNLAPVIDDVIIYPDLVKVKVSESSGEVIGLDAMHYAFNHTSRRFSAPRLSKEAARSKIDMDNVNGGRLALIPLQETKEVLTYEFVCENDGTYYVYIDANTGREANILYVIETDLGTVLQ